VQAIVRKEPRQSWVEKLQAAGVPSAPIQTIPEVLETPQTKALDILEDVPGTTLKLVGMPLSFNGKRPIMRTVPPRLGSSNQDFSVTNKD
jgi:formyl-CoA transferase